MTATVERIKRQPEVGGQRAVEHDRGQWVPPQSQKPNSAGFHRFQRDQAQGVIDEMGREVSEQHETRDQTYASNDHGDGLNLLRPGVYSPHSRVTDRVSVIRAIARSLSRSYRGTFILLLTTSTGLSLLSTCTCRC